MRELRNYRVTYCEGVHSYILEGKLYNRPSPYLDGKRLRLVSISSLDVENKIVTAFDGLSYLLVSPDGNEEEIFRAIQQIIQKG